MSLRLLVTATCSLNDQCVPNEMSRESKPLPGTEPGQRADVIPYRETGSELVVPVDDRFVVVPLGVKRVFQPQPGEEGEP